MYDTLQKIWVTATVIHVLPRNSYQVCTSNGSTYCHMWRHLHEHSVKAVNTVPSGTTATPQALTQHCFSPPQPAQHMQPTAAPAALATQTNQAPAVPATPAVQKNAHTVHGPCVVTHHCIHPQSFVELNCCVSYSQKGGCCMITLFGFKDCSLLHW